MIVHLSPGGGMGAIGAHRGALPAGKTSPAGTLGVGPVISLTFVLTIDDPNRFTRSRQVGAYLGLTPRQHQSGERNPQLHITKTGDSSLRTLPIQGAHYILGWRGPDSDLRTWGLARMERGGGNAKKCAVVAVAASSPSCFT